jgi:hypothetical protein
LKRAINAINELKLCYDPATGLDEIVEASTGSGQFVLFSGSSSKENRLRGANWYR